MPEITPQQYQEFQTQINSIQSGINSYKKNLGNTTAPAKTLNTGYKINVPDKIPSSVLGTNVTKTDVFSSRDALQKAFETYQTQSQGLEDQITSSLLPSKAESEAESALLEKTKAYRQGLANIENKPIAMEFITGQSAALQKQADLDLLASSEALQALTNKRKGVLESLTTQLGFKKQNFEDILGISKEFRSISKEEKDSARQDMQDIVSFAQGKTFDQLDPQTQSKLTDIAANSGLTLDIIKQGLSNAKVAFDEARTKSGLEIKKLQNDIYGDKKLDTQVVDLGGKKALINSQTGEVISYIGGDGSISPSVSNLINPVTGKIDPANNLASVVSAAGVKSDDKLKLTGAVLTALQSLATNSADGKFPGIKMGSPGDTFSILRGPESTTNTTYLTALEGTIESWMTGAAVSDDQAKRIKGMLPKIGNTNAQVRNRLNALTNYMLDYAKGNLNTQGVNYNPPKIDYFAPVSNDEFLNSIPGAQTPSVGNEDFFSQY